MDYKTEQRVETYYAKFLSSKRKFKYIKIKLPRRSIAMEYTSWYTDIWETQGWIYHKLPFTNYAKLYMFKGPSYNPPYIKLYRWFEIRKKFKEFLRTRHMVPDYSLRDQAEKYIAHEYLLRLIVLILISLPIIIPLIIWYLSLQK